MDEAVRRGLARESAVFVVTSTHRDGEVPTNGQALMDWLLAQETGALEGLRFAVLGIGNRIYPSFCAAAHAFDAAFAAAGAERAVSLTLADEIAGQSDTVKQWIEIVSNLLGAGKKPSLPASRPRVEITAPGRRRRGNPAANATLRLSDEMLAAPSAQRSTRQLRIELDPGEDGAPAPYSAGDHLAIVPENSRPGKSSACARIWGFSRATGSASSAARRCAATASAEPFPIERLIAEELDLAMPDAPEELLGAMRDAARRPRRPRDAREVAEAARSREGRSGPAAAQGLAARQFREPARPARRLPGVLPVARSADRHPAAAAAADVFDRLLAGRHARQRPAYGRHAPLRGGGWRPADRGRVGVPRPAHAPGDRLRVAVKPSHRQLPPGFDGPLLLVGAGTVDL
jgi:sulfite reductase alpha subunit-like flavoprotein